MSAKQLLSMFSILLPLALMVVNFSAALGSDADEDAKTDLKNLEGNWRLVGIEVGGKAIPNLVPNVQRTFSGSSCTLISGLRVAEGKFALDPSKSPKWIDETMGKGMVSQGIYELKGDMLRLFFADSGKARPTEFKTAEGAQQAIQTYARVAPRP